MYKEIKIGDVNVPMIANAATPLRYKMIFGKDLISQFQDTEENTSKGIDSITELAFIMAKAAEAKEGKADMDKLNQSIFVEWLEKFEPMDIPMASEEIVGLYMGNALTSVEPKKNGKGKAKEA